MGVVVAVPQCSGDEGWEAKVLEGSVLLDGEALVVVDSVTGDAGDNLSGLEPPVNLSLAAPQRKGSQGSLPVMCTSSATPSTSFCKLTRPGSVEPGGVR